jgi:hypothetical protein
VADDPAHGRRGRPSASSSTSPLCLYLGGADYSVADIAMFPWTRDHDAFGMKWAEYSHLGRWFELIAARPAARRAVGKVDRITSSATPRPTRRRTASSAAVSTRGRERLPLLARGYRIHKARD